MFVDTNIQGLKKDPKTGVIINTNAGQYELILAQRKKIHEENILVRRVEALEKSLKAINEKLGITV